MLRKDDQLMNGIRYGIGVLLFAVVLLPSVAFASVDSDTDGLDDEQEQRFGTNPFVVDTDGDGYSDTEEIKNRFSPLLPEKKKIDSLDTDADGLSDWLELWFGTDIQNKDTDGDGYTDYDEGMFGFSPTTSQPDKLERRMVVDLSKQQLFYVVGGIPLHTFPVSTGNPATPTPPGEYSVRRKVPVVRYTGVGYDFKGVKWNLEFLPHYYLHTAYWHNDFGKRTRSHGCVNMREADAGILYKYLDVGTPVSVVGVTPKHLFVGK